MADIKQAAQWMNEGKKVRRKGWADGVYYHAPFKIKVHNPSRPDENGYFWPCDLLADDWEIFKERM